MPATNGNSKEEALNKFDVALTKFSPAPRDTAASIIDMVGELRTQIAHVNESLDKLEGMLIKSSDHVSKSSSELLDALRLFSR